MSSPYVDLGRVANAQESRSCAMTRGSDGKWYLVILSSGFVVSVNLHTAKSVFCPFPDGYFAYPFGSMGSRTGKIYFGAGAMFYEFDPVSSSYTFTARINPTGDDTCECWSPFEAEDGTIWFGAYPVTHLMSFCPQTRELREHGVMAADQDYLSSVAGDRAGWIYCGMGTSAPTITAYHPATGQLRILARNTTPSYCGEVRLADDGNVYGALDGTSSGAPYAPEKQWHRLSDGQYLEAASAPFRTFYHFTGFQAIHCPYLPCPEILEQDLVEHVLTYRHPDTQEIITIPLDYDVAGAELSPITLGPDGKIYGTTNHPIQFFTCDPATDAITNYGRSPLAKHISGWGNICAYASQGKILAGAAYCGGMVVRIDTEAEICRKPDDVNPHCEGAYPEILRPRAAASLPDEKTVAFGGFTIYGKAGGGLLLYDTVARSTHLIPNEKLLLGQSILSILPLDQNRLLCATSIEAPGGGKVSAQEAEVFLFDLEKEAVLCHFAPVAGTREIAHLKMAPSGLIHGISCDGIFFTLDPADFRILNICDLSRHGVPVRDGMALSENGTLYGLLTEGIFRLAPGSATPEFLSPPPCPITCGMALTENKLYFGSNSHLWRCSL